MIVFSQIAPDYYNTATDNVGVTAFEVYINGVLFTKVTTTSCSITGLVENTAISFK